MLDTKKYQENLPLYLFVSSITITQFIIPLQTAGIIICFNKEINYYHYYIYYWQYLTLICNTFISNPLANIMIHIIIVMIKCMSKCHSSHLQTPKYLTVITTVSILLLIYNFKSFLVTPVNNFLEYICMESRIQKPRCVITDDYSGRLRGSVFAFLMKLRWKGRALSSSLFTGVVLGELGALGDVCTLGDVCALGDLCTRLGLGNDRFTSIGREFLPFLIIS